MMSTVHSLFSDLASATDAVFIKHLKNILKRKCSDADFQVLIFLVNNIVIPDDIFEYIANCCFVRKDSLSYIIQRRLMFDEKIVQLVNLLEDLQIELMELTEVDNIMHDNGFQISECEKNYVMSLLCEGNKTKCDQFSIKNIQKNYKTTQSLLQNATCTIIQLADAKMLKTFMECMQSQGIIFCFNSKESSQHKRLYEWLKENIIRGLTTNDRLGWQSGPDSGKWPSTSLRDYVQTLCQLYESEVQRLT